MKKLPPRRLLGIELFDFGLGQDIESGDTKKGTNGKIEQIEGRNHYYLTKADLSLMVKKDLSHHKILELTISD